MRAYFVTAVSPSAIARPSYDRSTSVPSSPETRRIKPCPTSPRCVYGLAIASFMVVGGQIVVFRLDGDGSISRDPFMSDLRLDQHRTDRKIELSYLET